MKLLSFFGSEPSKVSGSWKVGIRGGRDGAMVYAGGRKCGWRMNEGVTDGRKDGTYSAGLKDLASAYVLCPRLTEQLCLSIWEGVGNMERDLEGFRERWEPEKSAERQER